jgi:micrococcal nuclease
VSICLTLVSCTTTRIQPDAGGRILATVTHVFDGDTLTVAINGRQETIRLIGIDTPETVHPTKPVQCWGPEASAHTKSIFPPGTQVFLARDVEARDKYGRFLAYVYRASDNLFLNRELVSGGWARPYPFEPNTSLSVDFAVAANAAQQERLGLWAHCQG